MPEDGFRMNRSKIKNAPSRYAPPSIQHTTWLSSALGGTARMPVARQGSLEVTEPAARPKNDIEIYYAGNLRLLATPCVAVVGTRKLSADGAKRTHRLARELVSHGVTVVSGLATGVDAVAHTAALEAGGNTIAVIGTSLDKAYPADNSWLQERIYREHLLISQFVPSERVFRANFPARNKLMATISDATVIMEASDTSGTLHQAAECARLGRWLFIARSVVEDPSLEWPTKFLRLPHCKVLTETNDILSRILTV